MRQILPSAIGQARRVIGFTLAELLIVIAIIAVLISILLPTLASARRSANSVKCLSSLRQFGLALQMYAQENHRAFPVAMWIPDPATVVDKDASGNPVKQKSWQDFLAKYIQKRETNGDFSQIQNSSPFWGCPAYDVSNYDPTNNFLKYSTGYGMSAMAAGPYYNSVYQSGPYAYDKDSKLTNYAIYVNQATPPWFAAGALLGKFYKMEQWGIHGAERGIIADSLTCVFLASPSWTKANENNGNLTGTQPLSLGIGQVPTSGKASYISVEANRHLAPTSDIKKVMNGKGTNMLFVDGHAEAVTPRQAWIATQGGGIDTTK